MINPIIAAVAQEAAATDWPISGVTLAAPRISGASLLKVEWAQFETAAHDAPADVVATEYSRVPATILPMPPMADAETQVIHAAWSHGAWDIKRTTIDAGYRGALPPVIASMPDAVAQGYICWYWRPMMRAPEIRAKAHGAKDTTLNPWTLGRDGIPPPIATRRSLGNGELIIRLGKDMSRPRPSRTTALATALQRGYLGRLLRDAGESDVLPPDLTKAEASRMIDRIKDRK